MHPWSAERHALRAHTSGGRRHRPDDDEVWVGADARRVGGHHALVASLDSSHERSWCSGRAPICLSTTWPWSRMTSVGIDWTSNRRLTSGLSSALTLTSLRLPARSPASFSRAGLTIRQGPHHGAHTSTSTGRLDSSTTAWNSSSFASTTHRSGVLHFPHRGMPLATAGTRFLVPQLPHVTVVDFCVVAVMPLPAPLTACRPRWS